MKKKIRMEKVSSNDGQSKTDREKRQVRDSNKYLKPGALAQLRYNKVSAVKSSADLGKKRVAVVDVDKANNDVIPENKIIDNSRVMLSPVQFDFSPVNRSIDVFKQNNLQRTPKTPRAEGCESKSRLESLPSDLLVKILCHLHHDQLRAVFHVSQKLRKAVLQARQLHFNYTTPDRTRQEMLRTITPLPIDHWPFISKGDGKCICIPSPHTPKAPRHGPRPLSRVNLSEMRQIAAVLFREPPFPSTRCLVPSVLSKPLCKSLASNRVLFYEDELCQAVAQNKLC